MNKQELFAKVFPDGEAFVDYYFNHRRNAVKSYEHKQNDDTIATVGVVDTVFVINGVEYKTALLSGVCTAEEYRGQGIMDKLFREVLDDLKNKGYELVYLATELEGYYEKYGFKRMSGEKRKINGVIDKKLRTRQVTDLIKSKEYEPYLCLFYNTAVNDRDCYQKITLDDIYDLLDDIACSTGSDIYFMEDETKFVFGWFLADDDNVYISVSSNKTVVEKLEFTQGKNYIFDSDIARESCYMYLWLNGEKGDICGKNLILNAY